MTILRVADCHIVADLGRATRVVPVWQALENLIERLAEEYIRR